MTGRYDRWHHLSLRGDRVAAQRYVSYGRKLLAEVEQSLRASGNFQGILTKRLSDGTIVTAKIVGGIPSLTIHATGSNERVEGNPLEGFVVRPSPLDDQSGNTNPNHVLLRAARAAKPYFFNSEWLPEDFTAAHGFYETAGGLPMFDQGIGEAGNVDWRNGDETVAVSFMGPETRYFDTSGETFSTAVYFKGRQIFSLPEVEVPLLGRSDGKVRGACIRDGHLHVVVHYFDTLQREYLLRFPLQVSAAAQQLMAAAGATDWRLAHELELAVAVEDDDTRGGEVLAEGTRSYDTADSRHPWHFNQSGTEARMIAYDEAAHAMREYKVTEAGFALEATYSVPITEVYETTEYSAWPAPFLDMGITNPQIAQYVYSAGDAVYVGPVTDPDGGADSWWPLVGGDPLSSWEGERGRRIDGDPWVRGAVDFRDDSPVYAEVRVWTVTETGASSYDFGGSAGTLFTLNSADDVSGTINFTHLVTGSGTGGVTATSSAVEYLTGLKTDWATWAPVTEETATLEYTATGATSLQRDFDGGWAPTIVWDVEPPVEGTNGYRGYFCTDDPTDTWDDTLNTEYSFEHSRTERQLLLGYLDLRYQFAAVGVFAITDTSTSGASKAQTGSGLGGEFTPVFDAHSASTTLDKTVTIEISRAGVMLHTQDVDVSASTGSVSLPKVWIGGSEGQVASYTAMNAPTTLSTPRLYADFYVLATLDDPVTADPGSYSDGTETSEEVSVAPEMYSMRTQWPVENANLPTFDSPGEGSTVGFTGWWQVYAGGYCFSMAVPCEGEDDDLLWLHGLGNSLSGAVHPVSLPVLVGATVEQVRFHPVSFITKTAYPIP